MKKRKTERDGSSGELYELRKMGLGIAEGSYLPIKPDGDRYLELMLRQRGLLGEETSVAKLPTNIPDNLDEFYRLAGPLYSATIKGGIVKELTFYQKAAWEDRKHAKYRLYIKSQKIGMTSYFMIEVFHIALTYGRGKEILIVAQTKEKAEQILQELHKYIKLSPTYSGYLIDDVSKEERQKAGLLRDERTKKDVIYLRNPDNPVRPTKIFARGITSPGSLISFMNVCHVLMSDVTMAQQTDEGAEESFGALYTRLANTEGTMVIECPPRGPSGPIWDIVNRAPELLKDGYRVELTDEPVDIARGFRVRRLPHMYGIKAGVITEKFIRREKDRLGVRFGMYYETDFYRSAHAWFPKEYATRGWDATIPGLRQLNKDLMAEVYRDTSDFITGKKLGPDGERGYADESDLAKFGDGSSLQTESQGRTEATDTPGASQGSGYDDNIEAHAVDLQGSRVKPGDPKRSQEIEGAHEEGHGRPAKESGRTAQRDSRTNRRSGGGLGQAYSLDLSETANRFTIFAGISPSRRPGHYVVATHMIPLEMAYEVGRITETIVNRSDGISKQRDVVCEIPAILPGLGWIDRIRLGKHITHEYLDTSALATFRNCTKISVGYTDHSNIGQVFETFFGYDKVTTIDLEQDDPLGDKMQLMRDTRLAYETRYLMPNAEGVNPLIAKNIPKLHRQMLGTTQELDADKNVVFKYEGGGNDFLNAWALSLKAALDWQHGQTKYRPDAEGSAPDYTNELYVMQRRYWTVDGMGPGRLI